MSARGRTRSWERARRRTVAAAALCATVVNCAVGPNFTKPTASLPETWHAASDPRLATQPATDTAWWKSLGDPTLDRLIELAGQQNLPLQVAGLRIVEARAQLGIATGRQFPQF